MLKKFHFLFLFFLNYSLFAHSAQVLSIRYNATKEKIRIVLDISEKIEYQTILDKEDVYLNIFSTSLKEEIPLIYPINDLVVKEINFIKDENNLFIKFDLNYFVPFKDFILKNPDRIVIDFEKIYKFKFLNLIQKGLVHILIKEGTYSGPISINILDVDLSSNKLEIYLSKDKLGFPQSLSKIVKENNALAGINGGYFSNDGLPLGLVFINGEIIRGDILKRTALGIKKDGEVIIDNLEFYGEVKIGEEKILLSGVNRERKEGEVILYTDKFGETTKTNDFGKEVIVFENNIIDVKDAGNSYIPPCGCVLSFYGKDKDFKIGDKIELNLKLNNEEIFSALGGGPRLIKNGNIFITFKDENFKSDITKGKAPRTAVGITSLGHILLLTVDGREKYFSIGMTLEELSKLLLDLECVEAMNFDGGGSTTMVVKDKIVNQPSSGKERKIPTAILIFKK